MPQDVELDLARSHLRKACELLQTQIERGHTHHRAHKNLTLPLIGEKFGVSANAVQSMLEYTSSPERWGLDNTDFELIESLNRDRINARVQSYHYSRKRIAKRLGIPAKTMITLINSTLNPTED